MLFVKSNKNYHLQAKFFYYVYLNFNYIHLVPLFCYFAPGLKNIRIDPASRCHFILVGVLSYLIKRLNKTSSGSW